MATNDYVGYDALVAWAAANKVNIPPASPPPPPPPSGTPIFSAAFSDTANWTASRTSAYPGSPPQTNPGDYKLDILDVAPSGTLFTALRRSDGKWDAPLVTTEFSPNAFLVKPGNRLEADIVLPSSAAGSWPAIWTWQNGGNEVDVFEWHPDTAVWEFTNHLAGTSHYGPAAVAGSSHHLSCVFGLSSVVWSVDGTVVYSDGRGVPAGWSAYLIVNLSVAALNNPYHSGPMAGVNSLSYSVKNLQVFAS